MVVELLEEAVEALELTGVVVVDAGADEGVVREDLVHALLLVELEVVVDGEEAGEEVLEVEVEADGEDARGEGEEGEEEAEGQAGQSEGPWMRLPKMGQLTTADGAQRRNEKELVAIDGEGGGVEAEEEGGEGGEGVDEGGGEHEGEEDAKVVDGGAGSEGEEAEADEEDAGEGDEDGGLLREALCQPLSPPVALHTHPGVDENVLSDEAVEEERDGDEEGAEEQIHAAVARRRDGRDKKDGKGGGSEDGGQEHLDVAGPHPEHKEGVDGGGPHGSARDARGDDRHHLPGPAGHEVEAEGEEADVGVRLVGLHQGEQGILEGSDMGGGGLAGGDAEVDVGGDAADAGEGAVGSVEADLV